MQSNIPGISDHETVHVETQLSVMITSETTRQIFQWNKTDYHQIKHIRVVRHH